MALSDHQQAHNVITPTATLSAEEVSERSRRNLIARVSHRTGASGSATSRRSEKGFFQGVLRSRMSKAEIDVVTAEFFGAFDNRGGAAADVARIRRLVLPDGVIVMTGPQFTVYTVDEFIAPRERLLTDGRLVEFSEWETSERTDIAGDIASRFSEYRKSGILDGEPLEGGGTKALQFVRTSQGWRIAAVAWYDQP